MKILRVRKVFKLKSEGRDAVKGFAQGKANKKGEKFGGTVFEKKKVCHRHF